MPVVTFSAAIKIRLCLLLTLQRGPAAEGLRGGALAYILVLNPPCAVKPKYKKIFPISSSGSRLPSPDPGPALMTHDLPQTFDRKPQTSDSALMMRSVDPRK